MNRLLLMLAVALLLLSACKGCGGGETCEDVNCLLGEVCVGGECVPDPELCDPACDDDQLCEAGTCVTPPAQCDAAGDECDASRPAGNGFLCLDLDQFGPRPGECVAPCEADGSCPSGSLCFFVTSASDPACESNDDCSEGRECSEGQCLQTICRPSECDGFVEGAAQCSEFYENVPGYENGAQCYDVGNDARYCYPAGDQQEGDTCGDVIDAIIANSFGPTCASGLACVDDVCRQACLDDLPCLGDQECILEEQGLVDDSTGICGDSCTPFEIGSCGDGSTCIPVAADEGVCAAAGDAPAFEACTPGAGDCEDGTICVTYQSDPEVARCQPICNLTVSEANEDGSVGEFAQTQRDATCPQPESSDAWFAVTNLADVGAAVDVYIGDTMMPQVPGLALDARADGDDQTAGDQFIGLEPGAYAVRVLPAGAPSTDPPLVEQTLNLAADGATEAFVLPVAGAIDEAALLVQDAPRSEASPTAGNGKLRVVAALADVPTADVIVVPVGDDLSDPANQVEVVTDLTPQTTAPFVELAAQDWDLLVFTAGDPRTDRATALLTQTITVTESLLGTLALRGTVSPDDQPIAGAVILELVEPPAVGQGGPTFTCVDTQTGSPFGYCQQSCGGDSSGFGSLCEGDGFGCHPTFLSANFRWANLCAPQGDKALDDPCNPFGEFSECGEGLYCLEYGNTVPDYDPAQRGRCTSLCVEGAVSDPQLSCSGEQTCETISFDADFVIGQCGFPCAPDPSYGDDQCPTGLQSCKPKAALIDDPGNPDALPTAMSTQSFCSASGDLAAEETCGANDCQPGSECMFPRSEQATFTSTLLSQYFGAAGLVPSCRPQCDPFDGDSAEATCASGETCLFNFPYSAEVGHCAAIEEDLGPLQPCSVPGRSCGEDSICVVNAGQPTCFQFCQYTGPDQSGELQPESCAAGFLCAPLVNDIGVCLSPT